MDSSRAGPGSSNMDETGGGGGKCAVKRFDRAVPQEKAAQGQVHKMPHLVFISSFRTIIRN